MKLQLRLTTRLQLHLATKLQLHLATKLQLRLTTRLQLHLTMKLQLQLNHLIALHLNHLTRQRSPNLPITLQLNLLMSLLNRATMRHQSHLRHMSHHHHTNLTILQMIPHIPPPTSLHRHRMSHRDLQKTQDSAFLHSQDQNFQIWNRNLTRRPLRVLKVSFQFNLQLVNKFIRISRQYYIQSDIESFV